jgi:energy-coupling factor transport system ATP-binding protein
VLLVVGPSGSGKSTLALALAGLIPRDVPGRASGALLLDGRPVEDHPPGAVGARVGVVFQDPDVQIVMDRVEDDVAFGLENRAWPRAAMRPAVEAELDRVGLGGQARRHARALSGGQRQRLALAGALAPAPGVLVLDEPTASLDPAAATGFLDHLASLKRDRTATVVLVEHRVDAAWPLADVVLALGPDGAPIAVGPPDDVLRSAGTRLEAAGIWLPGEERAAAAPPEPRVPSRSAPLIEARRLGFADEPDRPVIRDVDLSVGPGERLALVGPNGGGKTTLARLLVGQLRPVAGLVRLAGRDPARLSPAELARLVGYVFQRPEEGFVARTVGAEIAAGLSPEAQTQAAALMERLGLPLERVGDRSPYRLSGGEARRLSLATALVRRPPVLVLDEPTFGQDRYGYQALLGILDELFAAGTTMIVATHDEQFVADVATRVVRVEGGEVAES